MYFDDSNKKYILLDIEGNAAQKENERKITQFAALIFPIFITDGGYASVPGSTLVFI